MSVRNRVLVMAAAVAVMAVIAVTYVLGAAGREREEARAPVSAGPDVGAIDLERRGLLLFRNAATGRGDGRLSATLTGDPDGPRTIGSMSCVRIYAAAGTGICLTVERSAIPKVNALVLDERLRTTRKISLSGIPSRARVSPTGRLVNWTVFVTGHSYAGNDFSTNTGVYDLRTGRLYPDLEEFSLVIDGKPNRAPERNFWGVTFAPDDDTFYATVRIKEVTYLVRGSLKTRTMRSLRTNLECPSLSPDGTRLAFKKATGDSARPWRLHVLDLATMRETPLAEPASIDDQAAWLDGRTVMYGKVGKNTTDVWTVPADGSGTPRLLVPHAFSPVPPR